jgi:hypothetical protein
VRLLGHLEYFRAIDPELLTHNVMLSFKTIESSHLASCPLKENRSGDQQKGCEVHEKLATGMMIAKIPKPLMGERSKWIVFIETLALDKMKD